MTDELSGTSIALLTANEGGAHERQREMTR
jgi:hypothetical protein